MFFPQQGEARGTVQIRFFGQECKKCSRKRCQYVDPEFDKVWIRSALERFYQIIAVCFYGKKEPKSVKPKKVKEYDTKGPHETKLCEACRMGCCSQQLRRKTYKKQLF